MSPDNSFLTARAGLGQLNVEAFRAVYESVTRSGDTQGGDEQGDSDQEGAGMAGQGHADQSRDRLAGKADKFPSQEA